MNRGKVKVTYNPYEKTIRFQQWDGEQDEYKDLSSRSKLSSSEYKNEITIQNKISDIFDILQNEYNLDNKGLDIEFEGTDDDYKDICDVQSVYHADKNIKVYRGKNRLPNASQVLAEIQRKYKDLEQHIRSNGDSAELRETIARYKDAVKQTVPIIVMGLYSAGKSTFINSLIGQEILPSSSDPTTARNYKITAGKESKVCFTYNGEKVNITFNGDRYLCNGGNAVKKLINDITHYTNEQALHTEWSHMYYVLELINCDKYNNHISDIIEITVPFTNSGLPVDEYAFEIYDTPGSDSASHEEHREVLKKSIAGQTNGLPILVTESESMDKASNKDLIADIDRFGEALDKTNTMVVVNKSDEMDISELEQKKNTRNVISKWKSRRIYFVSSAIGLGSKKGEPDKKSSWIDKKCHSIYHKNYEDFMAPEDREDYDPEEDCDCKQLYKYNIVSDDRKREYESHINEKGSIYINSGIDCVEREITQFAQKYSIYNKCLKAQEYLDKIAGLVETNIESEQKNIVSKITQLKEMADSQRGKLMTLIEKHTDQFRNNAINAYVSEMQDKTTEAINSLKNTAEKSIKNIWNNTEGKRSERIKNAETQIKNDYESNIRLVCDDLGKSSNGFWRKQQEEYKTSCMQLVLESSALTDEEKSFLKNYIMKAEVTDFDVPELERSNITKGFIFKKLDVKEWSKYYDQNANDAISALSAGMIGKNETLFIEWANDLKSGIIKNMANFNPRLRELTRELDAAEERRKALLNIQNKITAIKNSIKNLIEYKEVS